MNKYYIDPKTLLGRVILSEDKQEVVHLSLKKGNEVPTYQNNANIIILVLKGKMELLSDDTIILNELEMVKLESNQSHSMIALEDSQVFIVKVY